jgi:hypothetical protein
MAARKSPTTAPQPRPMQTYGIPHQFSSQLEYEFGAFVWRWPIDRGALTRYEHFRNICDILFPKLEWNPWLELQIKTLCDNQWVCFCGAAGASKTFSASLYAVVWWLAQHDQSSVILTSTTKAMIRKRAWPIVQKLHTQMPGARFGNLVDSKTTWQCKKGDDKNAIFAIAVAEGNTAKAVANIQGVHTKRQLVIIDEATDTPEAAFDACANLFNGCQDFQCLVIGNPSSHFDPMGKFCEPRNGWQSVAVNDDEWETKDQLNGKPGVVVRFDAEKSPNVIAGKTLYPYLVTEAQLQGSRKKYGESSPLFWKYQRGFWPPEGLVKTVFTESLIARMKGDLRNFVFTGQGRTFWISGLDPAFDGGDRAIQWFAKCAEISDGVMGIELHESVALKVDAGSKEPLHFQLAALAKKNCETRGVEPQCFGLDSTGEGGGLADIISREWSPDIQRVEFGGKPSDLPVSNEDQRPCDEAYDRRVTELWFTAKEFLISGQVRGITPELSFELCNRTYEDEKRKIVLEPKKKMKERGLRSPDEADGFVVLTEVARRNGVHPTAHPNSINHENKWDKDVVELCSAVYENANYEEEEYQLEAVNQ